MRYAGAIKLAMLSGAVGLLLTFTLPMLKIQKAQATPWIANGQPCGNCHTGSPPDKSNVKAFIDVQYQAIAPDDFPNFDVRKFCDFSTTRDFPDITRDSPDLRPRLMSMCLQDEQEHRQFLIEKWTRLTAQNRTACQQSQATKPMPSYFGLRLCLANRDPGISSK
jgi:hypothetical protein